MTIDALDNHLEVAETVTNRLNVIAKCNGGRDDTDYISDLRPGAMLSGTAFHRNCMDLDQAHA